MHFVHTSSGFRMLGLIACYDWYHCLRSLPPSFFRSPSVPTDEAVVAKSEQCCNCFTRYTGNNVCTSFFVVNGMTANCMNSPSFQVVS